MSTDRTISSNFAEFSFERGDAGWSVTSADVEPAFFAPTIRGKTTAALYQIRVSKSVMKKTPQNRVKTAVGKGAPIKAGHRPHDQTTLDGLGAPEPHWAGLLSNEDSLDSVRVSGGAKPLKSR
jgi:hypothetical protein